MPNFIYNGTDPVDGAVLIADTNTPPVANNDTYFITARSFATDPGLIVEAPGVLANDTDVDLQPLSAIKLTDPTSGTVTLDANGRLEYFPNLGFFGQDFFTYKANDGLDDSNVATVFLNVQPRLSIPTNLTATAGGTVTVPVFIDNPNPSGQAGGGIVGVSVALNFDHTVFTVDFISPGVPNVLTGTATPGWQMAINVPEPDNGELAVSLSNSIPNDNTTLGSVVLITFNVSPTAPPGTYPFNLVATNSPQGNDASTHVDTLAGDLPLRPEVTDGADAGVDGAVTIEAAASFIITAPPTATAGDDFDFTIVAVDSLNNTATGYTGTVQFTSTDPQAVLPNDVTLVAGVGIFQATFKTAGPQVIIAIDTVVPTATGTSNTVAVSAAAATHFTVVGSPPSSTAGQNVAFTVTALDEFNNTADGYTGTVQFTSTDPLATMPLDSTLTNGQGVFNIALKQVGPQTVTATDSTTLSIDGTSNTITVAAAAAANFSVVATPSSVTAGNNVSVTVTARDAFNNTATSYTGTVEFTSTDPQASPLLDSTLSAGSGIFIVTLKTAGPQTITATDATTPSINGTSNTVTVVAAAAVNFSVVATPSSVTAGNNVSVTVTARDAFNNTATSYTGTVEFTSTDPQAAPLLDSTLSAGSGIFIVTLKTAGPQTITATDATTPSINGTSNTVTVVAAAAVNFSVVATPSSVTAGNNVSVTVTARDAFNNTATSYTGTVEFTSTDPQASPLLDSTLTRGKRYLHCDAKDCWSTNDHGHGRNDAKHQRHEQHRDRGRRSGRQLLRGRHAFQRDRGQQYQRHGHGPRCLQQHSHQLHGHG